MRKVTVEAAADLEYEIGELTIRFLGDFPGIMKWATPADTGKIAWLAPTEATDFLTAAVHDDDKLSLAEALEQHGDRTIYVMAETVWRNALHMDIQTTASRYKAVMDALKNLEQRPEAEDTEAVPTED